MTQATTQNAKTKSAKADDSGGRAFDALDMSLEVPAPFREAAEKTVEQAKDAYTRMMTAGEEANSVVQETFDTARNHAVALSFKVLESTKANADASFDLLKGLMGAKTFAETIELQTAFARQQFETLGGQAKDWQEAIEKVATEVSGPAQTAWGKIAKGFQTD